MTEYPTERVEHCLVPFVAGTSGKLQTKDYLTSGAYPVIDQGRDFIAGWTDDAAGLISSNLPLVVFGDHTRSFKYVDFPFVRGADGTQILKPRAGIYPRFFYYACRSVDLPSRGYNRHMQMLKESTIPVPDVETQKNITAALDLLGAAIAIEDAQLQTSEAAKRSSMHTLFTRGLRGEAQKETEIGPLPESWEVRNLLELCEIVSGGTPRKSIAEYWGGDIPWVSGKDLKAPALDDTIDHITQNGLNTASRLAPTGAVLLLVRGMGLAKDLPVAVLNRPMSFNQDVKALISRGELPGRFIRSAIYTRKEHLLARIVPSAHGTMTLNLDDVETFKVACPTELKEATDIVTILDAIDQKIDLHRRKREVLDELFKSLLHKLMAGEIRVTDLDLSALAPVPSAEAAA